MNRHSALVVTLVLSFGILLAPLAAGAQQAGKVWRIGYLGSTPPTTPEVVRNLEAFRQGLRERGWVEGQNIVIEYRWAEGRVERFPSLAADLVSLRPDLLVTVTTPGARAAKQATSTIPIVMVYVIDPIGQGLVASLARPGGNITGQTFVVGPEIVGKQLELLKEVVPRVSRVAALWHPGAYAERTRRDMLKETEVAARALGVQLQLVEVRGSSDLDSAFSAMTRDHAGAFIVLSSPMLYREHRRIVDLAAKHRLPAIFAWREPVDAGGLMAYAVNAPDMFRRAAVYVDKILRGTKPADLPVEQPTRFELVINLKTAKALGLTIPQSVLIRADEVIQ